MAKKILLSLTFLFAAFGIPILLFGASQEDLVKKDFTENINSSLEVFSIKAFLGDREIRVTDVFVVLIYFFLVAAGMVFVALMVYGGYLWLTAAGKEDQVKKARETIVYATIGMVMILSAYSISFYILKKATCILYTIGGRTSPSSMNIPECGNKTRVY
jgi:hypothetical protein